MFVVCWIEGGGSVCDVAESMEAPCSRLVEYASAKCSVAVVQTEGTPPPDYRRLNATSAEEGIYFARCLIETCQTDT